MQLHILLVCSVEETFTTCCWCWWFKVTKTKVTLDDVGFFSYVTNSSSTLCKLSVSQCSTKLQQLSDTVVKCVQNEVNSNCEQFSSSQWFFFAYIQGHKSQKLCVENCVRSCGHSKWVWFMDLWSFILFMLWCIIYCSNTFTNAFSLRMLIFIS